MKYQPKPPISHRSPSTSSSRELIGWYFYDWANSAFSTTVVTVFLGPYLTTLVKEAADPQGFIYPLGIKIGAGSFFPYTVSLSVLLQVIFLPVLGAIADYSGRKKQMLALFAYLGAFATMGLYFLDKNSYLLGGFLLLLANFSFGASVVFYNAFLPELAAPEQRDAVSSKGWFPGQNPWGCPPARRCASASPRQAYGGPSLASSRWRRSGAGVRSGGCRRGKTTSPWVFASWRTPSARPVTTPGPCFSLPPTCFTTTASRRSSPCPHSSVRRNWVSTSPP